MLLVPHFPFGAQQRNANTKGWNQGHSRSTGPLHALWGVSIKLSALHWFIWSSAVLTKTSNLLWCARARACVCVWESERETDTEGESVFLCLLVCSGWWVRAAWGSLLISVGINRKIESERCKSIIVCLWGVWRVERLLGAKKKKKKKRQRQKEKKKSESECRSWKLNKCWCEWQVWFEKLKPDRICLSEEAEEKVFFFLWGFAG